MLAMAKKRKPDTPSQEPARPSEEAASSTPKRVRKGHNINVWIDSALGEALEKYRAKHRRSVTAEVECAIEFYLKEHGAWAKPEEDTP